jgi:ATP-GRASP peptide maturase of grasp-with-spasm system
MQAFIYLDMILIFSFEPELSTDRVINWLKHFNAPYIRIKPRDIVFEKFHIGNEGEINLKSIKNSPIDIETISTVWYRKWDLSSCYNFLEVSNFDKINTAEIDYHIHSEYRTCCDHLFYLLKEKKWLSKPQSTKINKLNVLSIAKKLGISIPNSCLTTSKEELLEFFYTNNNEIITKPLANSPDIRLGEEGLTLYTSVFTNENIENLSNVFFPSFFQAKVNKKYEIRSFYLDGNFYSMAIFSQANIKTQVDFRHYDHVNPNQISSYQLPKWLEEKLKLLMQELDLDTGSIDLIRDINGEYVFLEVNPTGQYDMVSYPCNYYLDKKVAEALIRRTLYV